MPEIHFPDQITGILSCENRFIERERFFVLFSSRTQPLRSCSSAALLQEAREAVPSAVRKAV
jgi:hypothetical protein